MLPVDCRCPTRIGDTRPDPGLARNATGLFKRDRSTGRYAVDGSLSRSDGPPRGASECFAITSGGPP